jgi:hypothetical protein
MGRFVIDLTHADLTGIVNGNPKARVPLFGLDLSHARLERWQLNEPKPPADIEVAGPETGLGVGEVEIPHALEGGAEPSLSGCTM